MTIDDALKDIIMYATKRLQTEYGYCGVAVGTKFAMLNSDDGEGNDIKINISIEADDE